MKMKKLVTAALLALASLSLLSQSAKAATLTYNDGDLLLGFRQSGATQDYLVDVGTFSSLPTTGSLTLSLGTLSTDLTAAFGSTWYTAGTVKWSVFGILGTGNGTMYMGNPTTTTW